MEIGDVNNDGIVDLLIGANFGENSRLTQGVRIAYSFNYFFDRVRLLEPDAQPTPAHLFGSPAISITFGKLF